MAEDGDPVYGCGLVIAAASGFLMGLVTALVWGWVNR